MVNVLFAAKSPRWDEYEKPLTDALSQAGVDVQLATDLPPEDVDYIVYAPNSDVQDFRPFTNLKAVLNLWAGVENVIGNDTLTVPLCRMVDEGLTEGMVEWVTGHVLRHHLGMDAHIHNPGHIWAPSPPPLARDRRVTVFGLGVLGSACASALAALNFQVTGWSRSPKSIDGVRCLAGHDTLPEALAQAEIAVLLMPHASSTLNFLDADRLSQLPKGAVILNPGRGVLIDDTALLAALDSGQVSHATLDTFRVEPVPQDHPYWSHKRVTITPHIASETRASSASRVIAENIARGESGRPFLHQVDRSDR